jgi:hypothetical protein
MNLANAITIIIAGKFMNTMFEGSMGANDVIVTVGKNGIFNALPLYFWIIMIVQLSNRPT